MNQLRNLLDSLKVHADGPPTITAEQLQRNADWCAATGEDAVCFSIGDMAGALELTVIESLVRLPFQTCWFESDAIPPSEPDLHITAGLLIRTDGYGSCTGQVWTKSRGNWMFYGQVMGTEGQPEQWRCLADGPELAEAVRLQVLATQSFLSALHCSNVRRQEHKPDTQLQKARAKRGKAPLFSYWTLQLDGISARGEDQGGTHASPRVHLRRGHPRQYAPGKWTWVQAHAVGNKASGMVHKDYSAGSALMAPAR